MKISYITVVIKPSTNNSSVDFTDFVNSNFPKPSLYKTILLCTNQRCNETDIIKSSHSITRFINGSNNKSFSNKKPIMCRIKGFLSDVNKFEIRISQNGNLKISIGFSDTNYNKSSINNSLINNKIEGFLRKYVYPLKQLPKYNKYEISNITITSFKLFNYKITNLKKLSDLLLPGISDFGYYVSRNKDSTLRKIYFKNDDDNRFPTVGLFSNGTMDFNGVKKFSFVKRVIDSLISQYNKIRSQLPPPPSSAH